MIPILVFWFASLVGAFTSPVLVGDAQAFHVDLKGNHPESVCIYYQQTTNLDRDAKGKVVPYEPYGCLQIPVEVRDSLTSLDLDWDSIKRYDADWRVWVNLYERGRVTVSNVVKVHR